MDKVETSRLRNLRKRKRIKELVEKLYPNEKEEVYRTLYERRKNKQPELIEEKRKRRQRRKRDWTVLNKKHELQDLYVWEIISEAVNSLDIFIPSQDTGRPRANPYDMLKLAILKTYQARSFRRINSFNLLYAQSGFVTKLLKRSTINKVYTQERFTQYLEKLYRSMADYLIPYEESFAVDSTGFGTRYNSRWVKIRLDFQKHKDYKKLHAICGINTHAITEVKISEGTSHDSPFFVELVGETAKRFSIQRVCADAGYISARNIKFVEDMKAAAFIMPRKDANCATTGSKYAAYRRMIRAYWENEEKWKDEYYLRQQIEVCYSMMKTTLLDGLLCKNPVSQKNELLIRVICHNLSVLVEGILRFNITPYGK